MQDISKKHQEDKTEMIIDPLQEMDFGHSESKGLEDNIIKEENSHEISNER